MSAIKKSFRKIAENQKKIGLEVSEKVSTYILAAIGFVVGLAWNDAIKTSIEYLFPMDTNNIFAKFVYAFAVTIIIVIATVTLTKKTEEKKIEAEN